MIAASVAFAFSIPVGASVVFSAILIPQLKEANSDIPITKTSASWIAAIFALAGPFGSVFIGFIMDKYGRLNALKFGTISSVLGWLFIALAPNIFCLFVGRTLTGFALMQLSNPGSVYAAEIARNDMRGTLVSFGLSFTTIGMLIMYLQSWFLHWKTTAWLILIYNLVALCFLCFIPESPSWLVGKGLNTRAKSALDWLHRYQPQPLNNGATFSEVKLQELICINQQKEARNAGAGFIREFLKPAVYKPLMILSGVYIIQQFSGVFVIFFYSVEFFESYGTAVDPHVASVLLSLLRLFPTVGNAWILKKVGRRPLLIVTTTGMGVCMLISGLFTHYINNKTSTLYFIPLVCILFYVTFSTLGLVVVPRVLSAELFPLYIRGAAYSTVAAWFNITMFLAVHNYYKMEEAFGGAAGVQWFFSGVSFFGVAFFYLFLPETHNKNFSEIGSYFAKNSFPFYRRDQRRKCEEDNREVATNSALLPSA